MYGPPRIGADEAGSRSNARNVNTATEGAYFIVTTLKIYVLFIARSSIRNVGAVDDGRDRL
jgi:hypothetical protein